MLTAFVVVFLALLLFDSPINLYTSALQYENVIEDNNILDDSSLDDSEQAGIERSDLEDQPDEGGPPHRDEYSMAEEEPEVVLSDSPSDPQESDAPVVKEQDRKEKRWIWSKKKKDKGESWVFNTAGATEGARGTALPEDEHVRNRAAEVYGNQYEKGLSQVSHPNIM